MNAFAGKERPILFSAPMIRAILEAHKEGLTYVEIAKKLGLKSKFHVQRICQKHGVTRPAKRRPGMATGSKNPAWKGGRRVRPDGYVMVWTPEGERLEHQIVMEKHLGRRLKPGEVVHHRDGNKQNNRVKNLELTTQSKHIREHLPAMHKARYDR